MNAHTPTFTAPASPAGVAHALLTHGLAVVWCGHNLPRPEAAQATRLESMRLLALLPTYLPDGNTSTEQIAVSRSASDGLGVLALGHGVGNVGVDVERIGPEPVSLAVSDWVMNEAVRKAMGVGLAKASDCHSMNAWCPQQSPLATQRCITRVSLRTPLSRHEAALAHTLPLQINIPLPRFGVNTNTLEAFVIVSSCSRMTSTMQ